jgi:hypothetical protein
MLDSEDPAARKNSRSHPVSKSLDDTAPIGISSQYVKRPTRRVVVLPLASHENCDLLCTFSSGVKILERAAVQVGSVKRKAATIYDC